VVAAAAVALARARGVALDPGLRLFALAGPDPADVPADPAPAATGDPAEALGAALERATDGGRRRAQGLHVTPGWLARLLTGMALDGLDGMYGAPVVCDPACGGGVFLVAAAERLHARGIDRADVPRPRWPYGRGRHRRPAAWSSATRWPPAPTSGQPGHRAGSTRWSATRRSRASSAGRPPGRRPTGGA
jgi:hypothetical protein